MVLPPAASTCRAARVTHTEAFMQLPLKQQQPDLPHGGGGYARGGKSESNFVLASLLQHPPLLPCRLGTPEDLEALLKQAARQRRQEYILVILCLVCPALFFWVRGAVTTWM